MSEPMTTVEIEDVLSSIRRLVSEDLRPTHKLVSAAIKNSASKLILTPALRIVADDRQALPEWEHAADDQRDLATVLQDIEVEDAGQTADAVPVFGTVRLYEHLDARDQDWSEDGVGPSADANFLATAMSRINGLSSGEPLEIPQGQSDRIEAVVAAVGAAVGPEEWEIDGGDPAPQSKAWGDTVWSDAAKPYDATAPGPNEREVLLLRTPIAAADTDDAAETMPHDLQADTVLQSETAEHDVDFIGNDSIVFEDAVLLQPKADVSNEADLYDGDAELDDTAEFLNEDILREIVRDMIREELQGTLGERITRNVRKLVRAEVNRALAAHDYSDRVSRA